MGNFWKTHGIFVRNRKTNFERGNFFKNTEVLKNARNSPKVGKIRDFSKSGIKLGFLQKWDKTGISPHDVMFGKITGISL